MRALLISILLCCVSTLAVAIAADSRGADLFNSKCTGCHSLDTTKVGPPLRAVFGRPAAKASGFPYSDGLKAARLVWNEPTLDKWLTDPTTLAPDTDMSIRLESAAERAEIIAYLKSLSKAK